MTYKGAEPSSGEQPHFRPGFGAYFGLVLATALLVGIAYAATAGFRTLGGIAHPGGAPKPLVLAELALCVIAWVHVANSLLRHHSTDDVYLTVYRPFGPTIRIPWEKVEGYRVSGYGQGFTLMVAGSRRISVLLDCLADGGRLAGIIQQRSGRRPGRSKG